MARSHTVRPASHETAWEPRVFDTLDAHDISLDTLDANISTLNTSIGTTAVPSLTSSPTTTLLWDGTNGGTADIQGRKKVNSTFWTYDLGGGETPIGSGDRWGNWEEQVYTDSLKNIYVKNGKLYIKAFRENTPSPVGGEVTANFSSGRIHTGPPIGGGTSKFLVPVNSYHEAKITFPETPGAWGAFWQMGANYVKDAANNANWPYPGEIDTVETFGQNPYSAGFALHTPQTGTANNNNAYQFNKYVGWDTQDVPVSPLYDEMPNSIGKPTIYGLWRSATEIRRYVNRKETFRYTQAEATASGRMWPFGTQGYFILINLAVGGQGGSSASIGGMGVRMVVEPISIWNNVTDPVALGLTT